VTSLRPDVTRDRRHLERIVELFNSGTVRAPEIKVYTLQEAAEAHRVSQGRHLRGKLVFKVR
jgi:NADPH:quinone reductase-like Zn-dependent oxidoreductase